jgi:Tol biopolymer transport system component
MGRRINSFNPEYAGSISADGKTLVFTSRRADTKGGEVDELSDNMYFEDIYISLWNDTTQEWSQSEPIPGSINTPAHDAVLSISPNGNSIYVYKSENGGDIFVSIKREDGSFGTAGSIDKGRNLNSSYFESSASVTEDENFIFFVSDRPGGKGQADVYTARKIGDEWTKPINLGDSINSEGDENSVFIHPDGDILFFTSTGHEGMGSYDIFYSKKVNGIWSKAKNLGFPINTVGAEKTISVTRDLKTAYVSSNYKGSFGGTDIFKIDLSKIKF